MTSNQLNSQKLNSDEQKISVSSRFAVLDLGTNSFHLLIADADGKGGFTVVTRGNEAPKLGEGGINNSVITQTAFDRGLQAMINLKAIIDRYNVQTIKCVGTSALRNATNGKKFIDAVKERTGIAIQLIDGATEAGYIYKGVSISGCLSDRKSLIMDIGGGSVEFILCTVEGIIWKRSFEIGAARLMEKFMTTDPISPDNIVALSSLINTTLTELYEAVQGIEIAQLIGSAGAFETFAELITLKYGQSFNIDQLKACDLDLNDFTEVTGILINSTHQQRMQMKGIIPLRVDMIVVAAIMTRVIIKELKIERIGMSTCSLIEGVMAELV